VSITAAIAQEISDAGPAVWAAATRLNRAGGVVLFDFRGHGRSGGESTLGDLEIRDVAVAVAYARELGYERIATVGFSMGASIVLRQAGPSVYDQWYQGKIKWSSPEIKKAWQTWKQSPL